MSFILDALKKSELDRQRQTVPGLMDTRIAQPRRGLPVWAIVVCALLGLNLLVFVYLLTRSAKPAAPNAAATPALSAKAPAAASAPSAADHFSPLDPAPEYAPEIPVAAADSAATLKPPIGRTTPSAIAGASAPHASHPPEPLLTDADTDSQEVLPTINELSLSGPQALPELHLDVHVYATKPAERFVYINMRKYHEGSTLQEGPTVEHIRRDGVVLSFGGVRFILPRQS